MAKSRSNKLPFDQRGGRITIQRKLLDSEPYISLSPQAKVLMTLLQMHWDNFKPIGYGVREAAKKIPCSKSTTMKAFKQLQEQGFIEMIEHSVFSSRTESKSRTWRLTWLPFKGEKPTNEWEKVTRDEDLNFNVCNSTVPNTIPLERYRTKNDTSGNEKSNHCTKNDTCGTLSY